MKLSSISILTLLFAITLNLPASSQTRDIRWPDSLNTAAGAQYLTALEREVIHEMNKVRTNPRAYARYIREEKSYYNIDGSQIDRPGQPSSLTKEGFKAVNECITALERTKPTSVLRPEEALCRAARLLAADQSRNGGVGHTGSDGSDIKSRVSRYGNGNRWLAENCAYGAQQARAIVVQLLIDDGVPSRGHRKTIMDPKYASCGVALDTHPTYRYVCVIDYASQ